MILIVCLDDKGGMAFNRRRQSKDRVLREQILALTEGRPLWMNSYSALQFEDAPNIRVDEAFLEKAGRENTALQSSRPWLPMPGKWSASLLPGGTGCTRRTPNWISP